MTAQIIDGRETAGAIRAELRRDVARLAERGIVPGLAVVLVGDDPASVSYVTGKGRACQELGIHSEDIRLPADTLLADLLDLVARLNGDPRIHGILVQLPLPAHIDDDAVLLAIDPDKDVDGFHPVNAGRLSIGLPGFAPCTPAGIIEMLKRYEIPLQGAHAVVVGRSNIVGKPMALMLLREHCTVTVCHSRTRALAAVGAPADLLGAAVGVLGLIGERAIKPGAVVVDVGMHNVTDEDTCRRMFGDSPKRLKAVRERGATLAGDVVPVEAAGRAGWLSPVPGGVGPLTIAMLLENALRAAEWSATSR